jgi:hypothetical protein
MPIASINCLHIGNSQPKHKGNYVFGFDILNGHDECADCRVNIVVTNGKITDSYGGD